METYEGMEATTRWLLERRELGQFSLMADFMLEEVIEEEVEEEGDEGEPWDYQYTIRAY